jgi:hexulose-6-phosphate isomerase
VRRRNFIKNTLWATGALSVASFEGFASNASEMEVGKISQTTFKKSIMWGTVGMEGSILEKCKAIKVAGFDGVEPNSHMDRQEMLEAMQATGLKASSVCNSRHWNLLLSHPDIEIRKQGMEAMIVAMEDAKAYGTDAVLLVPGRVDENVSYDDCWSRATECIKELLPAAQKLQVKMCIENVWNNFILSPLEARTFVDQFNSPYVRFYFDCGNILVYG